jgi:thymidylate synthase (FAD)
MDRSFKVSKIEVRLNPDTPPTGSDLSVVNAARRSFNTRSEWDYFTKGEVNGRGELVEYVKLKEKDKRLIEFLARGMTADDFEEFKYNMVTPCQDLELQEKSLVDSLWQWRNTPTHDTPFNHTFISFEVKAPIFVRAQLVKHEYLIMSEFSRRYITDDIEFYEPDYWRKAAPNKKQGSLDEEIDNPEYNPSYLNGKIKYAYLTAVQDYGVAPEQARMLLPQSTMTEWTWSGTLGAFAKMCQLRLHPEAQYEARLVAQEVYKHLKEQWPVSAPALVEGVK